MDQFFDQLLPRKYHQICCVGWCHFRLAPSLYPDRVSPWPFSSAKSPALEQRQGGGGIREHGRNPKGQVGNLGNLLKTLAADCKDESRAGNGFDTHGWLPKPMVGRRGLVNPKCIRPTLKLTSMIDVRVGSMFVRVIPPPPDLPRPNRWMARGDPPTLAFCPMN